MTILPLIFAFVLIGYAFTLLSSGDIHLCLERATFAARRDIGRLSAARYARILAARIDEREVEAFLTVLSRRAFSGKLEARLRAAARRKRDAAVDFTHMSDGALGLAWLGAACALAAEGSRTKSLAIAQFAERRSEFMVARLAAELMSSAEYQIAKRDRRVADAAPPSVGLFNLRPLAEEALAELADAVEFNGCWLPGSSAQTAPESNVIDARERSLWRWKSAAVRQTSRGS